MKKVADRLGRKKKRKMRIRKRIIGTAEKPRISVFKSNKHLYVQAIDDTRGHTITALSTEGGEAGGLRATVEDGQKFGEQFGKKLAEQKVKQAVFDRNGNLYHGVVKAVADGARKAGIQV
jgi:large subunit ribosomal protein L18